MSTKLSKIPLMSKAGLRSGARAVLYGLIVKQAAVVVPFACHMAVLAGLDEFFQSAPEQFRRGFHSLYVVDSYSLVERMERNEVVPCCRPCLECVQNTASRYHRMPSCGGVFPRFTAVQHSVSLSWFSTSHFLKELRQGAEMMFTGVIFA